MHLGRAVAVAIGWSALVGCEPRDVALRGGAPVTCAGPEGASCPSGQMCIDLADDGCEPNAGEVDCDGICVAAQCAGILGLPCAGELVCVDDPDDDCEPAGDGSDCPGICVEHDAAGVVSVDPRAPADPCVSGERVCRETGGAVNSR